MRHRLALVISLAGVAITASTTILVTAAEAQRRGGGGGGGRGGGGGFSRGGGGGGGGFSRGGGGGSWNARPSRPSGSPGISGGSRGSINPNISRGNRGQYGGGNRGQYGGNRVNQPIAGRGNRGNINAGNINRGNINTGDVNINRNIHVDNDWDGGWGGDYYRPGYGAAVIAGAAVTAAVVGSYYASLPPNCATVYRSSLTYYHCGSYWYQPTYAGTSVRYVVVNAP